MNKGFCGLYGLSTKTSAMTKVKARQPINSMSNLTQHKLCPTRHGMVHMVAHNLWSCD